MILPNRIVVSRIPARTSPTHSLDILTGGYCASARVDSQDAIPSETTNHYQG